MVSLLMQRVVTEPAVGGRQMNVPVPAMTPKPSTTSTITRVVLVIPFSRKRQLNVQARRITTVAQQAPLHIVQVVN